jgi:DNA-binding LytR/AlgR family response regulator
MNCIIVDDEPLARKGIELLINKDTRLKLLGSFNNVSSAAVFLSENLVDLVFLDIQMPKTTGLEFANTIAERTLVIFISAYTDYALNSYDVDAIDYLLKPVSESRFQKAVDKAISYHEMLIAEIRNNEQRIIDNDYIFVRSERRNVKIFFKDILFIEGLKDYVVIYTTEKKIITLISIKNIMLQLPQSLFIRVNKSYIINTQHITSFSNNDVFIRDHEIPIGNSYREFFVEEIMKKKMLNQ